MKRIYLRPITESTPVEAFLLLVNSKNGGPNGGDGLLPTFNDREVVLTERGDGTRLQLWDDSDDGDGTGVWK